MKAFAELGTVHRTEPCKEYPGSWILYVNGAEKSIHPHFNLAFNAGNQACDEYDIGEKMNPPDITICWKASDNDPRIGQVWFTSFYQFGKFSIFGTFKFS